MNRPYLVLLATWPLCTLVCPANLADPNTIPSGLREFCLQQGFTAECDADEVLMVTSARYGRMRLGRCIDRDYGFLGCGVEVTRLLTSRCSGRRSCHIANMESVFTGHPDCPNDLKPYLEAQWNCIKLSVPLGPVCQHGFAPVPGESGYISNLPLLDSATESPGAAAGGTTRFIRPGSAQCPWVVRAEPGQRVNLTLIDFTAQATAPDAPGPRYCREYATFREPSRAHSLVACDGDSQVAHAYLTDGHMVEVVIQHVRDGDSDAVRNFLLRYQVVGCRVPLLPPNMWARLSGHSVRVYCNQSAESWLLTCSQGHWTGNIGNCTAAALSTVVVRAGWLPLSATILIVLAVSVLICVGTLVAGLFHLKRRGHRPRVERGATDDALLYVRTALTSQAQCEQHKFCTLPARFATIDEEEEPRLYSKDDLAENNYTPSQTRLEHYATVPRQVLSPAGDEYSHIWEVSENNLQNAVCEECQAHGSLSKPSSHSQPAPGKDVALTDKGCATFKTFKPGGFNAQIDHASHSTLWDHECQQCCDDSAREQRSVQLAGTHSDDRRPLHCTPLYFELSHKNTCPGQDFLHIQRQSVEMLRKQPLSQ